MRAVRLKLSDENLTLLSRNEWDEKLARRHLAEAAGCIMRAVATIEKGIEYPLLEDVRVENRESLQPGDFSELPSKP